MFFLLGSIAGFLNANIVNAERFAGHVNQMRQDPQVATAIGAQMTTVVVDAKPDLVAIAPALQSATATLVASSAFDGVFTACGHLVPQCADPEGLGFRPAHHRRHRVVGDLARGGGLARPGREHPGPTRRHPGRGGRPGREWRRRIIPLFQTITALAWVLPVLALVCWAVAAMIAPDRRLAFLRIGWSLVAVAAALAVLALVGWLVSRLADSGGVAAALQEAAADEFGAALAARAMWTGLVGALLVVAASAALPQVQVHARVVAAVRQIVRRPRSQGWALVRALVFVGVGVVFVIAPDVALAVVAVLVGVAVLLVGITELDLVVERARERQTEAEQTGWWRLAWLLPVGAGVLAVVLLAVVLLPASLPQATPVSASTADPDACNGHVELCDRRFDEVAFPASHNSMSAADRPGWFLAEQPTGIVESLDDGIRVFLIDTWYGQATASGGVVTAERSLARAQADFTDGRATALTPAMRSDDRPAAR